MPNTMFLDFKSMDYYLDPLVIKISDITISATSIQAKTFFISVDDEEQNEWSISHITMSTETLTFSTETADSIESYFMHFKNNGLVSIDNIQVDRWNVDEADNEVFLYFKETSEVILSSVSVNC